MDQTMATQPQLQRAPLPGHRPPSPAAQGPRPAVGPPPLRRPVARAAAEGEGGLAGQAEHKVAAPPQYTEEQLRMRQALQQHQKEVCRPPARAPVVPPSQP